MDDNDEDEEVHNNIDLVFYSVFCYQGNSADRNTVHKKTTTYGIGNSSSGFGSKMWQG